jgi:hypothetical protein
MLLGAARASLKAEPLPGINHAWEKRKVIVFWRWNILEGQTLHNRITGKRLGLQELLDLAIQITDALDAAAPEGDNPSRYQTREYLYHEPRPGQNHGLRLG